MTKEEAFKNLVALHAVCGQKDFFDKEFEEALLVAEKALEQQPCEDATLKDIFCMGCEYKEQQPCEDAVSRAQAIEALKEDAEKYCGFMEMESYIPEDAIRVIQDLPAVTPTPKDDDRLKLLEFLYNTINPNEMERYMEMFKATNDKADKE